MRGPLSLDDLEDVELAAETAEQQRAAAAQLVAWAEEVHPDDEDVTPASLLVRAADLLEQAGDLDGAVELCRRAVTAEGETAPDARVYLHDALLRSGRTEEARKLADQIRRSRPTDLDVFVFMGENYEEAGDLVQAHRWYTLGVSRDLNDGLEGAAVAGPGVLSASMLVRSRRRVR